MVFGMVASYGAVMPSFIFSHGLRLNMEALIKRPNVEVLAWIERVATATAYIWQRNFTQHSLGCVKISVITSLQSSGHHSPWLLYVGRGLVRNHEKPIQHQRWTEGKDNGSIYQFKQGNRRKVLQKIWKSSDGCGWIQWHFLGINLINRISRYFQVILVNISYKIWCQCYFPFYVT